MIRYSSTVYCTDSTVNAVSYGSVGAPRISTRDPSTLGVFRVVTLVVVTLRPGTFEVLRWFKYAATIYAVQISWIVLRLLVKYVYLLL